ncbi:hypothetical protein MTR67_034987 [Solanum verrucosum]|uniref:Uncharacterized protein n=1 Tax=Solanum verrucosum TaxID=315347 RepID=A0AAF0U933_SOLVR|nr:hypothetical protein MTR67_034987 [Solanum verrucosum]
MSSCLQHLHVLDHWVV